LLHLIERAELDITSVLLVSGLWARILPKRAAPKRPSI
jgi:hypothetical protein